MNDVKKIAVTAAIFAGFLFVAHTFAPATIKTSLGLQ